MQIIFSFLGGFHNTKVATMRLGWMMWMLGCCQGVQYIMHCYVVYSFVISRTLWMFTKPLLDTKEFYVVARVLLCIAHCYSELLCDFKVLWMFNRWLLCGR